MDPQSQAFTPYNGSHETWKLQSDVARIQQVQQEHTERLARLERRQEEDVRVKSVWGNSSPFPSVLSGTPQQAPLQQPSSEHFRDFDDEANALMSSLHLDPEDEPRRYLGAASRANSVRFDETANQNHFSHTSRPSLDLSSRTNSGLGGLQMNERSSSHKSEARASSAHSIRSVASGRASSLNLDPGYNANDSNRSPIDPPGLAPGLLLLGPIPAIIRCWMNTNFKHDALLYAAVCTGSYKSYLDSNLVDKLGFSDDIVIDAEGVRNVELPVYFPEAVPIPSSSSRSSSPAPQLPALTVGFEVFDNLSGDESSIQVLLGSDTLRAHNADVLFSSNTLIIFDDTQNKLRIPLVRPENKAAFSELRITCERPLVSSYRKHDISEKVGPFVNGLGQGSSGASVVSATTSPPPGKYRPPGVLAAESGVEDTARASVAGSDPESTPTTRPTILSRPSLSTLNTESESRDMSAEKSTQATPSRTTGGSTTWGSWRRDGNSSTSITPHSAGLDWASASRNREQQYQRKETGIKVLKPKSASRAVSTSAGSSTSQPTSALSDAKSRFFDDGRRRSDQLAVGAEKKDASLLAPSMAASTSNTPLPASKSKSNPFGGGGGGGSAFSWMNSGSH